MALMAVLLLHVILASGCGTPAPLRVDVFYALDPEPLETPIGPPLPAALEVSDFAARGFLGGRQIVFRTPSEPLQVQRYERLLWADPLPRALSRNLVRASRAGGVFDFTLTAADRGRADYLLGGEIERFEHLPPGAGLEADEAVPAEGGRVIGTLNLALVRAADRRVLWDRRYHREVAVAGTTPDDMAAAFNRLAALLVAEVVRDLRALPRPPSGGDA
ncbi:hypothetical protein CKO25_05000 [Thiocapsa imhoffii]|uniref:ABC-type transport auxiliary lipoprotein component domain-containing protein n=2 Tax=Thiocapsa imhoffii TaxID=382777 RepID=A0A9X0WG44_9GAMM|nr:hypothetical protein [Thiocapsa imhoffii]